MRKLLILVDFSEEMQPLLTFGLQLSKHLNAQVWVQHVYYIPPNVAGEVFISQDALQKYEKSIHREFKALKENLPLLKEQHIHFVVSYGDLVEETNRLIDREMIALVMAGNHGGRGFLSNILGSNLVKIIQHAHCPVLSVPDNVRFKPFRHILFAADLKQTKPGVLSRLADFAEVFGAHIDVVHVTRHKDEATVEPAALDPSLHSTPHTFYNVWAKDIEEGIEQHVQEHKNDLIVLIPRAHPFFDRLFQKSMSQRVAYHTEVPLMTWHEEVI